MRAHNNVCPPKNFTILYILLFAVCVRRNHSSTATNLFPSHITESLRVLVILQVFVSPTLPQQLCEARTFRLAIINAANDTERHFLCVRTLCALGWYTHIQTQAHTHTHLLTGANSNSKWNSTPSCMLFHLTGAPQRNTPPPLPPDAFASKGGVCPRCCGRTRAIYIVLSERLDSLSSLTVTFSLVDRINNTTIINTGE